MKSCTIILSVFIRVCMHEYNIGYTREQPNSQMIERERTYKEIDEETHSINK